MVCAILVVSRLVLVDAIFRAHVLHPLELNVPVPVPVPIRVLVCMDGM
jgi:hypothetical protein